MSAPRPLDGDESQLFLDRWSDSAREPLFRAMKLGRPFILLAAFLYTRLRAARPYLRELPPGALVLDYGCGTAKYTLFLERAHRLRLVGVDVSRRAVQRGKELAVATRGHPQLLVGDCLSLPFGDACFDGAFSLDVIAHLPDVARGVAEVARVLRPGAPAVVYAETNGFLRHRWTLQNYLVRQLGFDPLGEADLHRSLTSREDLERVFVAAGLDVIHAQVAPEALLPFSFLLPTPNIEEVCRSYPQLTRKPLIFLVRLANALHQLTGRVAPLKLAAYLVAAIAATVVMPFLRRDTGGVTFKLRRRG